MAIEFTDVDRFLDCLRSDQGRSGVDIALEMHNVSPRSGLPAVQRLQGELLNFLVLASARTESGATLRLRHDCGELRSSPNRPVPVTADTHLTINKVRRACEELKIVLRFGQDFPNLN